MRREQTLEEISDGKLYDSNDMVKADSHNCEGCKCSIYSYGSHSTYHTFDIEKSDTKVPNGDMRDGGGRDNVLFYRYGSIWNCLPIQG